MKAIIRPTLISSSPSSFLSNPTTSSTACSSIISSALFSTTITPTTTTTTATTTASLWIDTDVGFDDLVAIGCCCDIVNDNVTVNGNDSGSGKTIAGISTVGGGLTSNTFDGVTILRRLLFSSNDDGDDDNNGENKFVTVPGRMKKSSKVSKIIPDPFWLTKCRSQMSDFCSSEGIILSNSINTTCGNEYEDDNNNILDDNNDNDNNRNDNVDDDDDAATAFLSTTMISTTDNKIDLICLGPLTNLAHWLDYIPDFAPDRLNSVWILGGNIPTIRTATTSSSSTSLSEEIVEAEFNFARDPEAVQTVLNHKGLHGKTIHIVPQEVCDRNAFERSFRSGVGPAVSCATAAAATFSASEIIDDWLTKCNISNNTTTSVSSLLPSWMVRLIRTRSFSLYGDPICIYIRDIYLHNNDNNNNNNMGNSKSDNDESNNDDAGNKTTIRWKNYYTSSSSSSSKAGNDNILEVDSYGRLLLVQQSATNMEAATTTATTRTTYIPVVNDNGKHVDDESNIDCNNCNEDDYSKYEGIDNNNNNNNNKYNNDSHNDDNCSGVTIRVAHEVDLGPAYLDWLTKALTTTATTTTTLL
ncbi:hypothetical protein FRACYDRAFT_233184 [Fragilariopsis cylindrus CCMP1102]|uniref:Inosine/uridine-preferring nucleoside hydrolase domain-containing protein n=1 Tax=Fragilariopsis cylindrus CCMP1102 TaxID=635003 RepID=A0A1E7FXY7_9STRA|nr:hypothetical protein FRACYDRAFT_233184 [Fragilariopsis cylindrus CCMP1102]|eukprot:OEU23018.1 hypothetical protein FRACYDRAFT_233184 [Fragilariopsis cylindrus CCMP1102]